MLPKVYAFTEEELKKLKIDPGSKPDEVKLIQEEISKMLECPAMWTGNADDHDTFVMYLTQRMNDICHFCRALSLHNFYTPYFSERIALGPGNLKFKKINGALTDITKTNAEFYVDAKTYVEAFYEWLPSNLITFKVEIEIGKTNPEDVAVIVKKEFPAIPDDFEIIEKINSIKSQIRDRCVPSSHIFVDCSHNHLGAYMLKVIALNRPVNPEHSSSKLAASLGFYG